MYTKDGKTMSIRAWCREFGISHSTIYERLKAGMTIEEALTEKKKPLGRKEAFVELDGKRMPLKECLKTHNISLHTYYYRRRKGMSDSEIFNTGETVRKCSALGIELPITKWCELTGFPYYRIYNAYRSRNGLEWYLKSLCYDNPEMKSKLEKAGASFGSEVTL